MKKIREPVIPCELSVDTKRRIAAFADVLEQRAPHIGDHGLSPEDFRRSGLLRAAIESLRGRQAATTVQKRRFIDEVLKFLRDRGAISSYEFVGSGERHDYEIVMPDGRTSIIETKGCLDGNNTNIFERPPQANEFVIWSLCQNPGADPRHNAWSGIHTRLSAEIIHRSQKVDGLIIWDMLCGTAGRPCPKVAAETKRVTELPGGHSVPPPCIYLLPATIPDPRNNPSPKPTALRDVHLLHAMWRAFGGNRADVVNVFIDVRMNGSEVERRTTLKRGTHEVRASDWAAVKRARR